MVKASITFSPEVPEKWEKFGQAKYKKAKYKKRGS